MSRCRRIAVGMAAVMGLVSACVVAPTEAGSGRAAILVVHGDGSRQTACVGFEGDSIDGEALLAESGFSSMVDAGNPMGLLVCAIDGEGCSFPAEPCLCACRGAAGCSYWAYFNRDRAGGWTYAVHGARLRQLHDGEVDGWVWLDRSVPGGDLPVPSEEIDFESICGSGS